MCGTNKAALLRCLITLAGCQKTLPSDVLIEDVNGRNKFLLPGLWDMHVHMMRYKWYESQMLDANPLNDIRNTTKINAVFANGILYDSTYVSSILSIP